MSQTLKKMSVSLMLAMTLTLAISPLRAAENIIIETQTHNVFKGFLLNIWSKFKGFNPHNKQVAKANISYTAGIRGAESTGTLVQPYWKDDLTQDPSFQKELKMYGEALSYLESGSLKRANASLSQFLTAYPSSSLRPNVLFAQGMSYAALSENLKASASFELFVKEYSRHPLASDVGTLLKQLK